MTRYGYLTVEEEKRLAGFLGAGLGAVLGAGAMLLLDPRAGRGRRARLRDSLVRAGNDLADSLDKGTRDFRQRTRGALRATQGLLRRRQLTPNEVLEARVRAKLGRIVSHPRAVQVDADQGKVTLGGLVLEYELRPLLKTLSNLKGVREVVSHLHVHAHPEESPSLQGGRPRSGRMPEVFQANWAPATRWLAGLAAAGLCGYGIWRRDGLGAGLAAAGGLVLARSISNREAAALLGIKPQVYSFHKDMDLSVSPDVAYDLWSHFDLWPGFIPEIKEVEILDATRSHWRLEGPLNAPLTLDIETGVAEPGREFSWHTVTGARFGHSGRVRFTALPEGGTRLQLDFAYHPPAGDLGNMLAKLLGADPKSRLEQILMQFKQVAEEGAGKPAARQG